MMARLLLTNAEASRTVVTKIGFVLAKTRRRLSCFEVVASKLGSFWQNENRPNAVVALIKLGSFWQKHVAAYLAFVRLFHITS
jgi:hypothetical protein